MMIAPMSMMPERRDAAVGSDKEGGADHAVFEPPLHRSNLVDRKWHRARFRAGVDQRMAAAIVDHEPTAVGFGDATANGYDRSARPGLGLGAERGNTDERCGRHSRHRLERMGERRAGCGTGREDYRPRQKGTGDGAEKCWQSGHAELHLMQPF